MFTPSRVSPASGRGPLPTSREGLWSKPGISHLPRWLNLSEAWHYHAVFGLRLRSRLALTDLPSAPPGEADVEIELGQVPDQLSEPAARGVRYQAALGQFLLRVDGVARYLVSEGRSVRIQPEAGASDGDVRLFLLGSALGALLHQREDLVLHGSAVKVGGSALVFLGPSGIGKSTLAAAFHRRGHSLLTDDVCVVRGTEGGQIVQPGIPRLRLWLDSLQQLEIAEDGLAEVRQGLLKRNLAEVKVATEALPVLKAYVLAASNKDAFRLRPLKGPRKFEAIKNQTYRLRFLEGLGTKGSHFQKGLALAQAVPIAHVERPRFPFRLDELVERIESDLDS